MRGARRGSMVSAWWLIVAFLAGGYAGILLMALMSIASRDTEESALLDRGPNW